MTDIVFTPLPDAPSIPGRNGGTLIPLRGERAREAANRRWEMARAATQAGIRDAGEQMHDLRGTGSLAVIRKLAEVHTLNAADPSAHGSQASYKQVMDRAFPRPTDDNQSGGGASITINMTGAAMVELARALGLGK